MSFNSKKDNAPIQPQATRIDPYAAWNWPRYFTYAQEKALEEYFEMDEYPWAIQGEKLASQIRADVDMVKVNWFETLEIDVR